MRNTWLGSFLWLIRFWALGSSNRCGNGARPYENGAVSVPEFVVFVRPDNPTDYDGCLGVFLSASKILVPVWCITQKSVEILTYGRQHDGIQKSGAYTMTILSSSIERRDKFAIITIPNRYISTISNPICKGSDSHNAPRYIFTWELGKPFSIQRVSRSVDSDEYTFGGILAYYFDDRWFLEGLQTWSDNSRDRVFTRFA